MTNKQKIPYNVYSIEDIDEWRNNFFYPLSLNISESIHYQICEFLIDEYSRFENDLKIHYRIASKQLYLAMFDFLMKLVLVNSMKNLDGYEYILTNIRCPDEVVLPVKSNVFELYKGSEEIHFFDFDMNNFHTKALSYRLFARSIKDRIKGKNITQKDSLRPFLINPNENTLKYIKSHYTTSPCWIRLESIFKKMNLRNKINCSPEISNFAIAVSYYLNSIFKIVTGSVISKNLLKIFEIAICNHFIQIALDFNSARNFSKKLPVNINVFTGTPGYFVRQINEAIRECGGKVTGFHHGCGSLGLNVPKVTFFEFTTCDRYLCLDKKEANDYKKYPLLNDIEFMVVPDIAESILNINSKRFRVKSTIELNKITTIMYLNYNYYYDHHPFGLRDYTVGFDMQLRVIEFLTTLNKKIIFKLRPKSALFSHKFNHFGYFGDKVEYLATPFRQILDKADLIILEGLGSSALYEAMTMTSTPIILFKPPLPKCTPEYEEILRKRCFVVDLYEDNRNRLCYDKLYLKKIFNL